MNQARVDIIEVLQLISSKSLQIDYHDENENPHDMPERFYRMWKLAYTPSKKKFSAAFSDKEIKQLATFDEFFLKRMLNLPTGIKKLMKNPYWNSVCEYAFKLLEDFEKRSEN